jgi:hypothetical protein
MEMSFNCLKFDISSNKWSHELIYVINLIELFPLLNSETPRRETNKTNYCLTHLSHYLCIIVDKTICIYDAKQKNIKHKQSILNEEFFILQPIEKTDDIIFLNVHSSELLVFSINDDKVSVRKHSIDVKYKRFQFYKSFICCSNLDQTDVAFYKENPDLTEIFHKTLDHSKALDKFCLSSDLKYLFIFGTGKGISMYRLSDGQMIANIPAIDDVSCMTASEMFLCVCFKDKRIVPYLIVDDNEPDHYARIKALPSR